MKRFVLSLLILFCSCGLFSPSDVAAPDGVSDLDPFGWKNIPESPNKGIFSFSYYTDVFHQDFIYENQSQIHQRSDFLTRLNKILDNYRDVSVSWSKGDTLPDPSLQNENEVELRVRDYLVEVSSNSTIETYNGEANFTLKKDSTSNRWKIHRWRDKDSTGVSFFNPQFQ